MEFSSVRTEYSSNLFCTLRFAFIPYEWFTKISKFIDAFYDFQTFMLVVKKTFLEDGEVAFWFEKYSVNTTIYNQPQSCQTCMALFNL